MSAIAKEKRVNDILLGPLERPALEFLVTRLPAWITPDMLTGLGFSASVLIFASYYLTNFNHNFLWLASFGFVLNWLGDSLDGTLARYRNIERPRYGFFIDHTVDALDECLVMLGIGLSPYADFRLAMLTLVSYLLLSLLVFVKTYVDGVFRISWARLGPTELRVIAILANTTIFFLGNPVLDLPFGIHWSLYNLLLGLVTLMLFIGYLVIMIIEANALANRDLPPRKPRHKRNGIKVYGANPDVLYNRGHSSSK